jgi:hypothetical protein
MNQGNHNNQGNPINQSSHGNQGRLIVAEWKLEYVSTSQYKISW